MNNYICLNCHTEQPKPSNPLGWCLHCFRKPVCIKQVKRMKFPNVEYIEYVDYIVFDIQTDGTYKVSPHMRPSHKPKPDWPSLTHCISCDDGEMAWYLMNECLSRYSNSGTTKLTGEQINYIKTITEFRNGKFCFKENNKLG